MSSRSSSSGNGWTDLTEEALDAQNREYQERLSQKTAFLKSIALDMEAEASSSSRLLDGLGQDFDSSSGLLSGSLARVGKMLGQGRNNRQLLCYMAASVTAFFVVVYYIIGRARA